MLTFSGCGKSQATVNGNAPKSAAPARATWQPAPIELPKTLVVEWINDEDEHATAGPVWPGIGSAIRLIRFNPFGDTVLIELDGGVCHLVDPKTGESRETWETGNKAKPVAMEPTFDGKRVVLQYEDDEHLYVRDLTEGTLLRTLEPPKDKTTALAVAADPRLLAVGSATGSLQIWNIETGESLETGSTPEGGARITAIVFSNDCQELYVADSKSTNIHVFELPDLIPKASIERTFGVPVKLATSWSGNWLFAVCHNRLAEMIALRPIKGLSVQVHHGIGSGRIRRGDLRNCFHLSNTNFVCCYLGGTAFDYYDPYLNPAGSADVQSAEQEAIDQVAVARDGRVAASGFPDGSVRFYTMPGPTKPVAVRQRELGERLRSLFQAEKYDELDELANTALTQVEPDAARLSPSIILAKWLTYVEDGSNEGRKAHLDNLQKWLEAKPESRAAHYVVADAIKEYAWFLRGSDMAARTGPQAMVSFAEQLLKADKLLKAADAMGPPSAPICATWAAVSMGMGKPKSEIIRLWERGIQQTPIYAPLHQEVAYALLPRWAGEEGDSAKLANRSLSELPASAGQLAYAAMAESFLRFESAASIVNAGFDLAELESAAQKVIGAYPECVGGNNFAAIIACVRQDHAAAAMRFVSIGAAIDERMWRPYPLIEKFRKWSQGNHVATDAEFSFLGSWMGLSQLAFAEEGTELITLGYDSGQQIRQWDVVNRKQDRVSALPPILAPLFMSEKGRFIACAAEGPERRIVVLDRTKGKMITWPGATLPRRGRISDDERQYATFGQNAEIAVYDLAEAAAEPAHLLKLDGVVTWVEFPHHQKVWNVVASEPNGRIRLLSEEGKDLITPVQLPRAVLRMKAVPDSPQILMCGQGLLALLNVESALVSKLVDEMSSLSEQFNYTALAVTRDGALAAAARADSHPVKAERPYEIEIWDLIQSRKLHSLAGHEAAIHTMSFSADGERLASGDTLGFVKIWNLKHAKDQPQ
jgi:WD40 repeat protein